MYISAADLQNAIGRAAYLAVFDEDNDGVVSDTDPGVMLCLRGAHALVASFMPDVYKKMPGELPGPVSELLRIGELDFCKHLAFERHPEYVRADLRESKDFYTRALNLMKRIAEGVQQIAPNDNPPEPVPEIEGGIVQTSGPRMLIDNSDGTSNAGDF